MIRALALALAFAFAPSALADTIPPFGAVSVGSSANTLTITVPGGTARTEITRAQDTVNAADLGMVCDSNGTGTSGTDNTAVVQALNVILQGSVKTVDLPAGPLYCRTTVPLVIAGNLDTVRGKGWSTTLYQSTQNADCIDLIPANPALTGSAYQNSVEHLRCISATNNSSGAGIHAVMQSQPRFNDVYALDFFQDWLDEGGDTFHATGIRGISGHYWTSETVGSAGFRINPYTYVGAQATGSIAGTTLTLTSNPVVPGTTTAASVFVGETVGTTGSSAVTAGTTITAVSSNNPSTCTSANPCTYTVSASQTVSSETLTFSPTFTPSGVTIDDFEFGGTTNTYNLQYGIYVGGIDTLYLGKGHIGTDHYDLSLTRTQSNIVIQTIIAGGPLYMDGSFAGGIGLYIPAPPSGVTGGGTADVNLGSTTVIENHVAGGIQIADPTAGPIKVMGVSFRDEQGPCASVTAAGNISFLGNSFYVCGAANSSSNGALVIGSGVGQASAVANTFTAVTGPCLSVLASNQTIRANTYNNCASGTPNDTFGTVASSGALSVAQGTSFLANRYGFGSGPISLNDNFVDLYATSANSTYTLPACTSATLGQEYYFVRGDSSSYTVAVTPNGSDTINGASTLNFPSQFSHDHIRCWQSGAWIVLN